MSRDFNFRINKLITVMKPTMPEWPIIYQHDNTIINVVLNMKMDSQFDPFFLNSMF